MPDIVQVGHHDLEPRHNRTPVTILVVRQIDRFTWAGEIGDIAWPDLLVAGLVPGALKSPGIDHIRNDLLPFRIF